MGVFIAAGLALSAAVFVWLRSGSPDSDRRVSAPLPPLTTSPFLNTKPGVEYVGDAGCAGCHRDQTRAYRGHPMGRSLFTPAEAPPSEDYEHKTNPFRFGQFNFQVVRQGGKLIHKEWCEDAKGTVVAQVEAPIAYVVGSGAQARSYIYERDGFLFQSPITWFTREPKHWHLSPGYEKTLHHFERRIESRCLYCHAQEARPVEHTVNRYHEPAFTQLAIGCERCHGPGALHVASRKKGAQPEDVDYTIVNPRHLTPVLREAVCEQCHLQGEAIIPRRGRLQTDYRPGLPLHEYVSVFVRPPEVGDAQLIVGHVEQMHLSACFKKSGGKFGCTSCHDPHSVPPREEKIAFYRQRCLACHGAGPEVDKMSVQAPACSLPRAERTAKDPRDNCLLCHMKSSGSSNATHLAVTDHRVPRHAERPPKPPPSGLGRGDIPLLSFHRDLLDAKDEDRPRDVALAMMYVASLAQDLGADPIREHLSRGALPLLDKAVARAPNDLPALEGRGFALLGQRQPDEGLKVFDAVLGQAADREVALAGAAQAAEASDNLDLAVKYGRRLTEKYPYFAGYHARLALLHAKRLAWPQVLEAAQAAVRADPFRAEARALLLTAYLEMGNPGRAQVEFDTLGVIDPPYQQKLRPWFAERLRARK
jgi:hypothetical protein